MPLNLYFIFVFANSRENSWLIQLLDPPKTEAEAENASLGLLSRINVIYFTEFMCITNALSTLLTRQGFKKLLKAR